MTISPQYNNVNTIFQCHFTSMPSRCHWSRIESDLQYLGHKRDQTSFNQKIYSAVLHIQRISTKYIYTTHDFEGQLFKVLMLWIYDFRTYDAYYRVMYYVNCVVCSVLHISSLQARCWYQHRYTTNIYRPPVCWAAETWTLQVNVNIVTALSPPDQFTITVHISSLPPLSSSCR